MSLWCSSKVYALSHCALKQYQIILGRAVYFNCCFSLLDQGTSLDIEKNHLAQIDGSYVR